MAYYNNKKILTVLGGQGGQGKQSVFTSLIEIGYTEPTGTFYFDEFDTYCSSFPYGATVILNYDDILYQPKMYEKLRDIIDEREEGIDDITTLTIEIKNFNNGTNGSSIWVVRFMSYKTGYTVCYELINKEIHKTYPVEDIIDSTITNVLGGDF